MGVMLLTGLFQFPALALPLHAYQHDRGLAREAHAIAVQAARAYLFEGKKPQDLPPGLDKRLKIPGGAFVTISLDGETRGCWGTVHPQRPQLAQEIAVAATKALRVDYRHRPITREEWPRLAFYVSLVGPLQPVSDPASLRPKVDGLFVTSGSRGGVLLPGEAKTARWQVAECRRKAGLKAREPAMLFRFPTVVYGPEDLI
jgi:AMMECR1 domain-containing protein